MKKILLLLNRLTINEAGIVLPMALIMLLFGAFLVVPLLALLETSLMANRMVEDNDLELYAADAGHAYAMWNLKYNAGLVLPAEAEDPLQLEFPETVNSRTVQVTISNEGDQYKISSTGTSDGGESTEVESFFTIYDDFSWLFDNAITSPGTVDLKNDVDVTGGIASPEEPTGNGTYDEWEQDDISGWPTADDFSSYYWLQAQDLPPESNPLDIDVSAGTIENPTSIGPLYAPGDVNISGSGVARLDGTADNLCMYIDGNLIVNNSCTFDLNGSTIFIEGRAEFKNGCNFIGSGCIIAVGEIVFKTNGETDPDGFIFLMSIDDKVDIRNGDNIYGSIAGDAFVEMKNGCDLTLSEVPEDGLNVPGADDGGVILKDILTYNIK